MDLYKKKNKEFVDSLTDLQLEKFYDLLFTCFSVTETQEFVYLRYKKIKKKREEFREMQEEGM